MNFLETLLALLLAAILLLQVSRRLSLPYPAMLASVGVVIALVPGSPRVAIEPGTALALFVAPALLDAAYDFPLGAARRFWAPLVAFAVVAVLITTTLVGWVGWKFAGLPVPAALALGAIVAPPDAAAAAAVLRAVSIPSNTDTVLKGESLFNDATALLLFGAALAVQSDGGLGVPVALHLVLAAPGGVLFGIGCALLTLRINRFVTGTLGGNLLQFVITILVWTIADRLSLSAVLSVVAFAMTIARLSDANASPRMRVHSDAVWASVVFVLNVLAFLLMGMQARIIVERTASAHLREASGFAALVVATVVISRLVVVIGFNRWMSWRHRRRGQPEPASIRQAVLVGWSGMRGLVTLATAFALPASFPRRDEVVLAAFSVVLATLVVQGLTLGPLIRLLGLSQAGGLERELSEARASLAAAALEELEGEAGQEAASLRRDYVLQRESAADPSGHGPLRRRRMLGLAAIAAERKQLEALRAEYRLGIDTFSLLQEELDWRALTLLPDDERRMEEG